MDTRQMDETSGTGKPVSSSSVLDGHTPGPWERKKRTIGANESSYYGAEGKYIGMFSFSVGKHQDMEEWKAVGEANARLIASAPALKEENEGSKRVISELFAKGVESDRKVQALEADNAKLKEQYKNVISRLENLTVNLGDNPARIEGYNLGIEDAINIFGSIESNTK